MAVADVFSALTEERPYHKAMSRENVMSIMNDLACSNGIDSDVVKVLEQNYDDILVDKLRLKRSHCRLQKYKEVVEKLTSDLPEVKIGVICKYENMTEAYLSVNEALIHAGVANGVRVIVCWIKTEDLDKYKDLRGIHKHFEGLDGLIIPGGFDSRGIESKLKAIQFAREKKIAFLGICLGLQLAVIEFARNVCGLDAANSIEFDKNTPYPVIHYVKGQENLQKKSATMRLGAYNCELLKSSLAYEVYGSKLISERHRHRFEVNPEFIGKYESKGLIASGINPESGLVEIVELSRDLHPYFIAHQGHIEFKSKLMDAAPLFRGLIAAARHTKNQAQP